MLSEQDFLDVVRHAPLVSIDLVVCSPERRILMGQRLNRPAAGYWFVPGGRICKNETLPEAFRRICAAELGTPHQIEQAQLLGGFTHLYGDNFAGEPGVGTHYVVLAYRLDLQIELAHLPEQQHSGYRWIGRADTDGVHPNSQAYFPYLS